MKSMNKILVVGGSGMIGHRMWASLSEFGHDVYATSRTTELDKFAKLPGIDISKCFTGVDVNNVDDLRDVFSKVKPNIVLNCVGIVKQLKESKNPIKTIYLNALFPHILAELCEEFNSRMVQYSTDCVFDGIKGNYKESDEPNATDLYGKSKALGEIADKAHVVTLRTSSIGREVKPHGGLVEWFLSQEGSSVKGFSGAIYSGFPSHALARLIDQYIIPNKDISGIVHLSADPIDKFELLNKIKTKFDLNIEIADDPSFVMKRGLNSDYIRNFKNINVPNWNQLLDDLSHDWDIYNNLK